MKLSKSSHFAFIFIVEWWLEWLVGSESMMQTHFFLLPTPSWFASMCVASELITEVLRRLALVFTPCFGILKPLYFSPSSGASRLLSIWTTGRFAQEKSHWHWIQCFLPVGQVLRLDQPASLASRQPAPGFSRLEVWIYSEGLVDSALKARPISPSPAHLPRACRCWPGAASAT